MRIQASIFIAVATLAHVVSARPHTAAPIGDEIESRALAYFLENTERNSGLTLDKAYDFTRPSQVDGMASIAATGFGMAVLANAAERGLLNRKSVEQDVLRTLRFAAHHLERFNGWMYHFVDWRTGRRIGRSEFSTIDTAFFISGALYAAQVFPHSEIESIANSLYSDLDFENMRTDGGRFPGKLTLSMGYVPETGYIPAQWDMYAEQSILLLLGLGHSKNPLPLSSWFAFSRDLKCGVMGFDQALFVHQYPQLFVDFRNRSAGLPDFFRNSVAVTTLHRRFVGPHARFASLRAGFWGFSAGLAPGGRYEIASAKDPSSTVCIGCAVGSAMFAPNEVSADARSWLQGPWRDRIWGRYGFIDSIDVDRNWTSDQVLGITVGAEYLSIANTRAPTVWSRFMKVPAIESALSRIRIARSKSPTKEILQCP